MFIDFVQLNEHYYVLNIRGCVCGGWGVGYGEWAENQIYTRVKRVYTTTKIKIFAKDVILGD